MRYDALDRASTVARGYYFSQFTATVFIVDDNVQYLSKIKNLLPQQGTAAMAGLQLPAYLLNL